MMIQNVTPVIAYIGLGSNLQKPKQQIDAARSAINQLFQTKEIAFSSLYQSPPMGPQDQPDYVNAVMEISTQLTALELLCSLQRIEHQQGRIRQQRWGARTLDLDILLYDQQMITTPELTVPHIGMAERAFVLYPLYEIAPQLAIPQQGQLIHLVNKCPLAGLKRLAS